MDFDGVMPSSNRPRQVKCGILVYFEPRSAPQKPPLWLKSKNVKPDRFREEKNWVFQRNTRKVQPLTNTILSYRLPNVKTVFHLFPAKTVSFPTLSRFCTESTKNRRGAVRMCTCLPCPACSASALPGGRMSPISGHTLPPGRILS